MSDIEKALNKTVCGLKKGRRPFYSMLQTVARLGVPENRDGRTAARLPTRGTRAICRIEARAVFISPPRIHCQTADLSSRGSSPQLTFDIEKATKKTASRLAAEGGSDKTVSSDAIANATLITLLSTHGDRRGGHHKDSQQPGSGRWIGVDRSLRH